MPRALLVLVSSATCLCTPYATPATFLCHVPLPSYAIPSYAVSATCLCHVCYLPIPFPLSSYAMPANCLCLISGY
eukprot:85391-Rhodomonas_salina.1